MNWWFWVGLGLLLVIALAVAYFYDRKHRARGDLIEGGGKSRRDSAVDIGTHMIEPDDGTGKQ